MNLVNALGLKGAESIAFTGAGGKTSAMFALAQEIGSRVVLTTTTHLGVWQAGLADDHRIINSSKDISTLYLVAKMPSVRLHVIHMVRDSRAVAYSWQRKRVKHQVTKQVTYMPTYSPAYAAFDWAYRNSFVAWGKPLYDSYHFMRYEDLVQDPVTILNKLTGELGIPSVDWSFINQATLRLLQTTHTASGNPMRFQSGALALKLDDIWKQEMSDRSKRIVTGLNWPWLRRYQYV